MVDSLHFHKGTVDKNFFEKAETEIGFSINNGKIKCKLQKLEFFHKITIMLGFLKVGNGKF